MNKYRFTLYLIITIFIALTWLIPVWLVEMIGDKNLSWLLVINLVLSLAWGRFLQDDIKKHPDNNSGS